MKHFVNLALVPFFLTLVITGLLRFLLPFSLVTTRIHIIFGIGIIILVGLHLISRLPYFRSVIRSANASDVRRRIVSNKSLLGVLGLWIFLLLASMWDLPPTTPIINASYESRHRATIFRSDPQTVYEPVESGMRLKRETNSDSDILLEIDWGDEFPESYGRTSEPFSDSRPQIAIWTESETGTLVETLFLSEKVAYNESLEWGGEELRRVDILPIWRNRFTLTTGIGPDGEETKYFSGATPEHSFSIQKYLKTDSDPFYLYVEVNAPKDSNEFYNSESSDEAGYVKPGIGQPSVLYGAHINPNKKKQYLLLDLIGHGGSNRTSDGNIHYDLNKLTSATKLLEKIIVRVKTIEEDDEISNIDVES